MTPREGLRALDVQLGTEPPGLASNIFNFTSVSMAESPGKSTEGKTEGLVGSGKLGVINLARTNDVG